MRINNIKCLPSDCKSKQTVWSCGLCCDKLKFKLHILITIIISLQAATELLWYFFTAFTSVLYRYIRYTNTISPPPTAGPPCLSSTRLNVNLWICDKPVPWRASKNHKEDIFACHCPYDDKSQWWRDIIPAATVNLHFPFKLLWTKAVRHWWKQCIQRVIPISKHFT